MIQGEIEQVVRKELWPDIYNLAYAFAAENNFAAQDVFDILSDYCEFAMVMAPPK